MGPARYASDDLIEQDGMDHEAGEELGVKER
jgi:hypothetical protein